MTIEIFADRNCRGDNRIVDDDLADLRRTAVDRPSSLRMTSNDEAILLFRNDDWRGGVHYVRGSAAVTDLGRPRSGGRRQFRNSIRSVRITPFTVTLTIHRMNETSTVQFNPDGSVNLASLELAVELTATLERIVGRVNQWFDQHRILFNFWIRVIRNVVDPDRVVMGRRQRLPMNQRHPDDVDIVSVGRIRQMGVAGASRRSNLGQRIILARQLDTGDGVVNLTEEFRALMLAHHFGRFLGLRNEEANGIPANIMFGEFDPDETLADRTIIPNQVRAMHDRMANSATRRRSRLDAPPQ